MKPCLYVCETCRFSQGASVDESGLSGGQQLHRYLLERAAKSPLAGEFTIRTTRCLMSCEQHCNVHLRAPYKIGYVAGRFTPDEESADAIMAYFERYIASETGQVPYKSWPQGIKGHFIARIPPVLVEDLTEE